MDNIWLEVLGELVTVVSGVVLAGVSGLGAFYINKLTNNMKRKSFKEDICVYVRGVEQRPLYRSLRGEEKFKLVYDMATKKALENGISIDEQELVFLVESQVKLMKESEIKAISNILVEDVSGSTVVLSDLEDTLPLPLENEEEPKG